MGKISRGWQLTKLSFGVIRKDKELLLFPIISGICVLLIAASFIVPFFLFGSLSASSLDIAFFLFWILFYFVSFFISTFFSVALMGCAMMRLDGGNPTFGYGIKFASERVVYILEWALVAATVGMILRALEERAGFIGKIVIGFIGLAWAIATYFAVPVLAFEKLTPFKALRRSVSILKASWGESLVSNLGLGLIFLGLALIGIPIVVVSYLLGGVIGLAVGLIIAIIYWVFIGILAQTVQGVLTTALYRFATTGKTSAEFPDQVLANPWVI